jgi:hypothetical protein
MGPIILVVEVVKLCIKPTFGFQNNYLINHKIFVVFKTLGRLGFFEKPIFRDQDFLS